VKFRTWFGVRWGKYLICGNECRAHNLLQYGRSHKKGINVLLGFT
jgi:hypothetical protein